MQRSRITSDGENRYTFPKSEEIVINRSDLHIQLENFKSAILSSLSIFDIIAIVSLWSPIFSSDFKEMLGTSPQQIRAGYIAAAAIITIVIIFTKLKLKYLNRKGPKTSTNSKIMAEKILEQCNPQSKH